MPSALSQFEDRKTTSTGTMEEEQPAAAPIVGEELPGEAELEVAEPVPEPEARPAVDGAVSPVS